MKHENWKQTNNLSFSGTIRSLIISYFIVCSQDGKYTSMVVIQHHPMIQRKGDRIVHVACHFEATNRTISNTYSVLVELVHSCLICIASLCGSLSDRLLICLSFFFFLPDQHRMPSVAETSIVKEGQDITGARLGDELYLRLELDDDEVFGIFARELVAKSGSNQNESIMLVDSEGCPTDPNIFPILERIPNSKGLMVRIPYFYIKFKFINCIFRANSTHSNLRTT